MTAPVEQPPTTPCCPLHLHCDIAGCNRCCDPTDCGPCCENCPTCPRLPPTLESLRGQMGRWIHTSRPRTAEETTFYGSDTDTIDTRSGRLAGLMELPFALVGDQGRTVKDFGRVPWVLVDSGLSWPLLPGTTITWHDTDPETAPTPDVAEDDPDFAYDAEFLLANVVDEQTPTPRIEVMHRLRDDSGNLVDRYVTLEFDDARRLAAQLLAAADACASTTGAT